MSVSEAFSLANEYGAIPLALIGFGVTFVQIWRTRKAASATKLAVDEVVKMVGHHLEVGLLPTLLAIESDIENSAREGNHRLAAYQMGIWRKHAGELRGLLGGSAEDKTLGRSIQASIKKAAEAKIGLRDESADVYVVVADALKAISSVTAGAGQKSMESLSRRIES